MLNTRAPNSTFICGSQGSGKSYTLSCILENCLLPDPEYGAVANPVAGVAFHYDDDDSVSLAEVASLCARGIDVKVLVSYSNYRKLKNAYLSGPGAAGNLTVEPLLLENGDLDTERMLRLMAFSDSSGDGVPLYVEVIHRILRDMAKNNQTFTFNALQAQLDREQFAPNQKNMLNMRINLLESFLSTNAKKADRPKQDIFATKPGTLTIVDLSDAFVDSATACLLFEISLNIFKQRSPKDGMIITLEEPHKYLTKSPAAENFTEQLLSTIRLQRHTGTRVIIATQEPTISEKLLDLCSTSIVHRFTSPAWFAAIKDHLAGASSLSATEDQRKDMLEKIVHLNTGESFVFSPPSFLCLVDGDGPRKLGTGVMKMKTRGRKGIDSGKSKMAGGSNEVCDLEL